MDMAKTTAHSIRCGHCHGRHATVADVKACGTPRPTYTPRPSHNHPLSDPTMRQNCTICQCVHAMTYVRGGNGRYVCGTTLDTTSCPACQARR